MKSKNMFIMLTLAILGLVTISGCTKIEYTCQDGTTVSDESLCANFVEFKGHVDRGNADYGSKVYECDSTGYCKEVGVKTDCYSNFFGFIENVGNTIAKDVKVTCDGYPDIEKVIGDINLGQRIDVQWTLKQQCTDEVPFFDRCFVECSNCGEKQFFSQGKSSNPYWKVK